MLGVVCGVGAIVAVAAGASSPAPEAGTGLPVADTATPAATGSAAQREAVPVTHTVSLIGDSYAAGDGGGSYLAGTDTHRNRCHRSAGALLSGTPGVQVRNLACSRATTAELTGNQYVPTELPPQLGELSKQDHDAVVVMIGGNDIDFAGMIQACVVEVEDCSGNANLTERVDVLLSGLQPKLETAYAEVGKATTAEIIVPAYPQLFFSTSGGCPRFTEPEMQFGSSTITRLNQAIEAAVSSMPHSTSQLRYVRETQEAFEGRGVCSDRPLIHSVRSTTLLGASASQSRAQELLHPTAEGYKRLTAVLAGEISVLSESASGKPEGNTTP